MQSNDIGEVRVALDRNHFIRTFTHGKNGGNGAGKEASRTLTWPTGSLEITETRRASRTTMQKRGS